MEQGQFGIALGAQQLGRAIGGALGGVDPQLQKITQRQQLLGMIDPNNPDSYAQAIQTALQAGDQEAAFLLRNEMMRVQEQASVAENRRLEREGRLIERGLGMQKRGMESMALSLANGIDPETGEPTKPLFDPITRTFNQDVADQLISRFPTVGADIVKTRLESVQGIGSLQEKQAAKKQEAQAQEKSKLLFKEDGTIDQNVYADLLTLGQVGQNAIDRVLKGRESIKSMQAQQLAQGLFNPDGTPNLSIVAELRKTPEGRKILEENAPKTISVKDDETIMTVPVLGEASKVIRQGQKVQPFTGTMANAANLLYQTTDPKKIFDTHGQAGLDKVNQKAQELAKQERSVTNLTVQTGMQAGFGKNLTDTITSNIQSGRLAKETIGAVDSMQVLLDEGVKTGFGQETMLQFGKVGQALNPDFNIKGLAGQEALQSISTKLVLPQVKQLGVNPTDTDLKFINTGSPTLSKTVAGNKLMLAALKLKLERDQDLARFTNTWLSQNTKLTETNPIQAYVNFNTDFDAYTQSSPLYAPSANRLREQFNALGSSRQSRAGQPNARDALERGGLINP
jgi:hypothetical protein